MAQKYKEFSPTPLDKKGAFLPNRGEWLVVPVSRTRDTGPYSESNFEVALKMLGGESDTVEIHRFGHWGPGWFEIIIVDPKSGATKIVQEIENSLDVYPILDESDWSDREMRAVCEYWENMDICDRIELCKKARISIFASKYNYFPFDSDPDGRLYEKLTVDFD